MVSLFDSREFVLGAVRHCRRLHLLGDDDAAVRALAPGAEVLIHLQFPPDLVEAVRAAFETLPIAAEIAQES